MESDIVLVLTKNEFYSRVFIFESVIYDDDSTIKSLLKNIFQDMKSNNPIFLNPCDYSRTKEYDIGDLIYEIPVPCWHADPMQHHNIVGKKICDILVQVNNKTSMTKCDCLIVKNIMDLKWKIIDRKGKNSL